eukprot:TRINITY_DN8685_c0_g2_i1.p1 TRINITY_DN8685_c0_g2~~TRINITY_DN8685_c0_g2_i1.p1  ORF type:complete len:862 (+),score=151.85 TRINITY_DN8685_c0_g2_i1:93-2588(+)
MKSLHFPTTHFTKIHEKQEKPQHPSTSYFHHISSLCKEGRLQEAVSFLNQMQSQNLQIGPQFYGELLQGCVYERAVFPGQQIHAQILKNGDFFSKNEYVETKLLIFYAKCDISTVACDMFCRLRKQNVFSWAAMIGLWCRDGLHERALLGFCQMLEMDFAPDNFVVPNALKACSALQWIQFGKGVHGFVSKMGLGDCVYVASSLVDMYGKCGFLEDARVVFDEMPERNVVAWNSMIVGHVHNGMNEEAMEVFCDMRVKDFEPTRVTLASFLSASANLDALDEGRQGHAIAVLNGLELDNILGSSLINFYSKVGFIEDAEHVFCRVVERDVVTWNLLISGYVQVGQVDNALEMCHQMRLQGLRFDSVTLASMLAACAGSENIDIGKQAHGYCIRNSLESDVVIASSIADMYAKCGRINDARWVFDITTQKDLVMWNTLIAAYAHLGLSGEAMKLFYQMQLEGAPPNVVSLNAVILGFLRNGQIKEADDMFKQMQYIGMEPNIITWTTLISGMAQNGYGYEAILLFQRMQAAGIRPNSVCIISVLSACTSLVSLQYGKAIHGHVVRHWHFMSLFVLTSLIDMYAKCGSIYLAEYVFKTSLHNELPLYNAMIAGYALHGKATEALSLFARMQEVGLDVDDITFTGVLSACNHVGLVDEGLKVFASMFSKYHVRPSMEHYSCVVTLLSQCGNLDEALRLISEMPFEPDAHMLGSMLAACREHSEIKLAEYLSQRLFKLEPGNAGNYVTLSNTYAAAGKWNEVWRLRDLMKEKELIKNIGCSWINVGRHLHAFIAGDRSHPQTDAIYETLTWLEKEMRFMSYVPMPVKAAQNNIEG